MLVDLFPCIQSLFDVANEVKPSFVVVEVAATRRGHVDLGFLAIVDAKLAEQPEEVSGIYLIPQCGEVPTRRAPAQPRCARMDRSVGTASRVWVAEDAVNSEVHPLHWPLSPSHRLNDVAGEGFHGGQARGAVRAVGAHTDLVHAAGEQRLAARDALGGRASDGELGRRRVGYRSSEARVGGR